jgi:hypothetical protein
MKSTFFIIICLLSARFSFGQLNDSLKYFISFAGTGNINKTNSGTSYIFNNALKFNINGQKLNVNTFNSWIYGENPTKKTNNDFLSALDVDLFKKTHKWYYWVLAAYEKSYSLKIDNRFQVGGGIGYNLLEKPNSSIVLTDGILYEKSDLVEMDVNGREKYETARNSFRLKYRFVIKEIFKIDGSNYLQNSFSDKNDYNIRSTTNLSVRLKKWLSFTASLTYNKIYITNSENLLFSYGLTLEKFL